MRTSKERRHGRSRLKSARPAARSGLLATVVAAPMAQVADYSKGKGNGKGKPRVVGRIAKG
jgi:hypothetical protein